MPIPDTYQIYWSNTEFEARVMWLIRRGFEPSWANIHRYDGLPERIQTVVISEVREQIRNNWAALGVAHD